MARPPRQPPMLLRASVSFHTNDEDKDDDTQVDVYVFAADKRTIVARSPSASAISTITAIPGPTTWCFSSRSVATS